MEQTTERRRHDVWREQCEAAETIRHQYGIGSAFDYVVGEKLLTFAEDHAEFARAIPQFVSDLRHMFTPRKSTSIWRGSRMSVSSAPWTRLTFTIRIWTTLQSLRSRRAVITSAYSASITTW